GSLRRGPSGCGRSGPEGPTLRVSCPAGPCLRSYRGGRSRRRGGTSTSAASPRTSRGGCHPRDPSRRVAACSRPPSSHRGRRGTPRRSPSRRSEEHTSELQSLAYLVCRLLLEKKKRVRL